ncbi:hypothetical protein [Adlercreutzia mucosicola]|uniref:DUF3791 domain-containing protein n=1 Tax=Adlercreutzia mucosicola TaxID=580026 RepID=A0A6N8JNM8_9ACTN|nr:hypothetical protein [Adlercreutzia mucosicola]MEB1814823.1 hypothetical protein [Adlercreutzia mucosicola]MVX61455.1 hypothetical protein [Adlercreutzia mucosicola]
MITENSFSALLGTVTIPSVMEKLGIRDVAAAARFYDSEVYALLSDKDTALWHLSPTTLADMYRQELSGSLVVPEEQS